MKVMPASIMLWLGGGMIGLALSATVDPKQRVLAGTLLGAILVGAIGDKLIETGPFYVPHDT